MPTVAVIGGGSWATALVKILSEQKNCDIRWWMRNQASMQHIRAFGSNPHYLSAVVLDNVRITLTPSIHEAVEAAEWVILSVPAAFIKESLSKLTHGALGGKYVVSTIKGMVPEENMILADYLYTHYSVPLSRFSVVTGPCHARKSPLKSFLILQ